jgi:hypothetical protein
MEPNQSVTPGFVARLGLACRILFNGELARRAVTPVADIARSRPAPAALKPVELPPERQHAAGLQMLSMLQREGRFIDFLQQEVAAFSEEDVGAAARVVHEGCRKVLKQTLTITPVLNDAEGASVTIPKHFDAQRIRLTGNVTGEAPYKGSLKHHGWYAQEVRLPIVQETLDPRVVAPAEVEL